MRDHVLLLGWFVATAVVNFLLRTKTAAEWEALAERSPRYAAFARLLRAVGVDPVKLIESFADMVRGRGQVAVALPAAAAVAPEVPAASAEAESPKAEEAADLAPAAEPSAAVEEPAVEPPAEPTVASASLDASPSNGKAGTAKPAKTRQTTKRKQEKKGR